VEWLRDGLIWLRDVAFFSARQHTYKCRARYMLSPVRLSVTRVYHTKAVEVRIMKF